MCFTLTSRSDRHSVLTTQYNYTLAYKDYLTNFIVLEALES